MRRPQRWIGPQDQQRDGGQLLIVATKKTMTTNKTTI
jgi:hypothetical protein